MGKSVLAQVHRDTDALHGRRHEGHVSWKGAGCSQIVVVVGEEQQRSVGFGFLHRSASRPFFYSSDTDA